MIKATWLSSRNDVISTTGFALLGLVARVAPVRWPEYLFDLAGGGAVLPGELGDLALGPPGPARAAACS